MPANYARDFPNAVPALVFGLQTAPTLAVRRIAMEWQSRLSGYTSGGFGFDTCEHPCLCTAELAHVSHFRRIPALVLCIVKFRAHRYG